MRRISHVFCLLFFASFSYFIEASRSRIGVLYDEDVVDVASASAARTACMKRLSPLGYEIDYVPIETLLLGESDLDEYALLVIPGGQTTKIETKLEGEGRGILNAFHRKGGHCLGICGGAFLLSQTTKYEGVSSGDILHRYGVAPVHSEGPYPGGEPRCVSMSVWQDGKAMTSMRSMDAFWVHGGLMRVTPDSLGDDALEVVARYNQDRALSTVKDPIAIVKYQPNEGGRVILSQVHIEDPRSDEALWPYVVDQFGLPALTEAY